MTEPTPPDGPTREMLARLLRQRGELGAPSLFLEGLGRAEALRLAGSGARGAAARPAPESAPSDLPAAPFVPPKPRKATPSPRAAPPLEASGPVLPLPVLPSDHEALRELVSGCVRCRLSQGRTRVVFNDGVTNARLMVVGEAPGQNEDEMGLPFVGASGKLLDLLLATVDLSRRESVYICNVIKCRPPGNRNPLPDEIESCRPYLERQIEIVSPEVILGVGTFAAQWLTRSPDALGKLRGQVYSYHGVPLVVTYHPAALLRNAGWTPATWDDFQLVRQLLDRGSPA